MIFRQQQTIDILFRRGYTINIVNWILSTFSAWWCAKIDQKRATACFSGHRKIPPERLDIVTWRLREAIIDLIEHGYLYFGTDGALGFDTLAAQAALDLKVKYPQIKLILVLPCLSQLSRWNEHDQVLYEDIKIKADKIVYTSRDYTKGCMHKCNRHLVDNSSTCICYLTESTGGTAYTVDYARRNHLLVINTAR